MSSSSSPAPARRRLKSAFRAAVALARWTVILFGSLWAFGAVYYDGPLRPGVGNLTLAIVWVIIAMIVMVLTRGGPWRRALAWVVCFLCVLVPWKMIRPSNDLDWQPEWRETGHVELDGDEITFHALRNFDYDRDGNVTERWEDRVVRLSNLRGVDYFHTPFGGWIAHPIVSFDFGPDGHVALSIETRREIGESFSNIGGLYKLFELQYIFASERDVIRLRTNIRDEPVYFYRTTFTPDLARTFLLDSIHAQNDLYDDPDFYGVIGHNCTTSLRVQTPAERRSRFDIRMLANGRFDELLMERDIIAYDGLSFDELRGRAAINEVAQEAHDDPAFSDRIRAGRIGFDEPE